MCYLHNFHLTRIALEENIIISLIFIFELKYEFQFKKEEKTVKPLPFLCCTILEHFLMIETNNLLWANKNV